MELTGTSFGYHIHQLLLLRVLLYQAEVSARRIAIPTNCLQADRSTCFWLVGTSWLWPINELVSGFVHFRCLDVTSARICCVVIG